MLGKFGVTLVNCLSPYSNSNVHRQFFGVKKRQNLRQDLEFYKSTNIYFKSISLVAWL